MSALFQYRRGALCASCRKSAVNRCCGGCNVTAYCSEQCARSDWDSWHRWTCPHIQRLASRCPCSVQGATPSTRYRTIFLEWVQDTTESSVTPLSKEEERLPVETVEQIRKGAVVEAAEAIKQMDPADERIALKDVVTTEPAVVRAVEDAEQAVIADIPQESAVVTTTGTTPLIGGPLSWVKGRFRKFYQGCDINPKKNEEKCLKEGGTAEDCAAQREADDEDCKNQRKKAMVRGGTAFSG